MENNVCPYCGAPIGEGISLCHECGKEIESIPSAPPPKGEKKGRNPYAVLAVLLVVIGGAAILLLTGILPNPLRQTAAAIVNGERISQEELDKKVEMFKKIYSQVNKTNFSGPEGERILNEIRKQVLNSLIQEKVLLTEAQKEKIAVTPQEIKERIETIKKSMNLSDKDFESFLKNHGMSMENFEKRVEKDTLIAKLLAKAEEKGMTQEAWVKELNARAKVEILQK